MNRAPRPLWTVFLVTVLVSAALFVLAAPANKAYGVSAIKPKTNGTTQTSPVQQSASLPPAVSSIITNVPYGISNSVVGSTTSLYATQTLGYSEYSPDLWNIASTSIGSVTMASSPSGGVTADVSFTSLGYGASGATVIGYPNIMYGNSPWGGGPTPMSSALTLPRQVRAFSPTLSVTGYSVNGQTPPMDFSYDIWITQAQHPTTVSNGDLELMLWTDHANGLVPAGGSSIGTFTTGTLINGTYVDATWNIFVSNGNKATASTWTIVTFQLQSPTPQAQVGVNLTAMFSQMINTLTTYYPQAWSKTSLENYYVEQIDLGSEFANPPGLNFIACSYSWTLSSWYFLVNYSLSSMPASSSFPATQATGQRASASFLNGQDSVDDTTVTGLHTTVYSAATPDGTQMSFDSVAYDSALFSGAGGLQINGNSYYSIQLSSASSFTSSASAEISVSGSSITSSTQLNYWSGSSWTQAENQSISGSTVSAYVPLSFLGLVVTTAEPQEQYSVTFHASGLPSGTTWTVDLGGATSSSSGTSAVFSVANGSYPFSISPTPGYTITPQSGTLTVQGQPVSVSVTFSAVTYPVTFTESGLPSGTEWFVNLTNGQSFSSTAATIQFGEPNGTYAYTVGAPTGYTPSPSSGTVLVNGTARSEAVAFGQTSGGSGTGNQKYAVTFTESGLPQGMTWTVVMNGTTAQSSTDSISFNAAKGTYYYSIYDNKGYRPVPSTGSVTVDGSAVTVMIVWMHGSSKKYTVSFSGVQLTPGAVWSVSMGGQELTSSNSTIVFDVPNGTYYYTANDSAGSAKAVTGVVSVSGQNLTIEVPLGSQADRGKIQLLSTFALLVVSLTAAITALAAMSRIQNRRGGSTPSRKRRK